MKLRKSLLVVLMVALMSCLTFGMTVFGASANDEIVFTSSDVESVIKDEYSLGQEVSFPESIEIEYKGKTYNATDGLILYPSGLCYELGNRTLNEAGIYSVKYFFDAEDGTNVTATIEIEIVSSYYNLTADGDGSQIYYYEGGTNAGYADAYNQDVGALVVELKDGNSFKFNKPIDLSNVNNKAWNSTNAIRVTPLGADYVFTPHSTFSAGASAFTKGAISDSGSPATSDNSYVSSMATVADATGHRRSQLRLVYIPQGVNQEKAPIKFEIFGYDKNGNFCGKLKDASGNTTITDDWILEECPNKTNVSQIKVVVKALDDHALTDSEFRSLAQGFTIEYPKYSASSRNLVVRFTDAYNPSIFVEVLFDSRYIDTNTYIRARSNNQAAWGSTAATIEKKKLSAKRKNFTIDGELRGFYADYGVFGPKFDTLSALEGINISWDNVKNRAYWESWDNGAAVNSSYALINDFNNAELYGDTLFAGFTTGEVYVSIYGEEYNRPTGRIAIHQIGEYDYTDLIAMQDQLCVDDVAPNVDIECELTDSFGVYAAIGDTVTIPNATVSDINLLGNYAVNVYRNYSSGDSKIHVPVVDGKFVVSIPDIYTIEYKARDKYGNETVETLNVNPVVSNSTNTISIVTEQLSSLEAGVITQLPEFTIYTPNSADKVSLKISAINERETIVIDNNTREFMPSYSGKYLIKYEVNDNIAKNVFSYEVNSVASATSVTYKEVPTLPRYLIKGQKYKIDKAFAFVYDNGAPEKAFTDMYVVFDNGTREKITDNTAIEIKGNSEAYFVYSIKNVEYVTDSVQIVDVMSDNGVDMYKYFLGNFSYNEVDPVTSKRNSDVVLMSNVSEGSNEIQFINALDYNSFSFKFQVKDDYDDFNKLGIRLTGLKDKSQQVYIEVERGTKDVEAGTESNKVYLNGNYVKDLSKYFFTDSKTKTFSYSPSSKTFNIGSESIDLEIDFDGSLCTFDIILSNITGANAGILISNINNQKISGKTFEDAVIPQFSVTNSQGEYVVGDEITFNVPVFSDVLSQIDYSTVKFYVQDDDNEYAVSTTGVKFNGVDNDPFEPLSMKFTKLTTYRVRYEAKDYEGNIFSNLYFINVVDNIPPTITLTGVKEGETLNLGKFDKIEVGYTINDNVSTSANCRTSVMLINTKFDTWRRDCGTSIQLYEAGEYIVRVLVQDEVGNISYVEFYVVAK